MRTDSRAGRLVRAAGLSAVLAVALPASVASGPTGSPRPAADARGSDGEFTPVAATRLVDTRSGRGSPAPGPIGPDDAIEVQVSGRGGVPESGAKAVVLNVTVIGPTEAGYLTVHPPGTAPPEVSSLTFPAGAVVTNMATAVLGPRGTLTVRNAVGSTHVLLDVVGFYSSDEGPSGDRFTAVAPYRRFDTRDGRGSVDASPIGPGGTLSVDMSALDSPVPAEGVSAVVLSVTATGPTEAGFLRVTPAGRTSATSSLNFAPGQTAANLVTVPVSSSGGVDFHNALGSTHVVADIVGYYGPAAGEAGRFVEILPERAIDTRTSAVPGALPAGLVDTVNLGWAGAVPSDVVGAAVLNVTVVGPSEAGYLVVFDDGQCQPPGTSSVTFAAGQTVASQVITALSRPGADDSCSPFPYLAPAAAVAGASGQTHYVIDVFGYFTDESGATSALGASGRAERPPAPGALVHAGIARRGAAR